MAKKQKGKKSHRGDYSNYLIEELLGNISKAEKETGWDKYVVRARFVDKPSTIDIRRIKVNENEEVTSIGKGIALTNEEADTTVDILVKLGYGTNEVLENEITRRKALYGLDEGKENLTSEE